MKSARSSVALIKKDSEVSRYALIFEAELILNLKFQLQAKKVFHLLNRFLPLHHGSHICYIYIPQYSSGTKLIMKRNIITAFYGLL